MTVAHVQSYIIISLAYIDISYIQANVECKLLTSIFYDLGKGLAENCPYPLDIKHEATGRYFMKALDCFLLTFPTLDAFVKSTKLRIENGTNNLSCLAFLRMHARNGFTKIVKTRANSAFNAFNA